MSILKIKYGVGVIERPEIENFEDLMSVYEITIRKAFENESFGHLEDEILKEIAYKRSCLKDFFDSKESKRYYLIAKYNHKVIGTLSFGPIGEETLKHVDDKFPSEGEMGGLYILPDYQNQGIASQLFSQMIQVIKSVDINYFSFDSGYELAQSKWIHKFGVAFKIIKDYWGKGTDHMIWLCKTSDY